MRKGKKKMFKDLRKLYSTEYSKCCGYFVIIRKDINFALGGFHSKKDANAQIRTEIENILRG